MFNQFPILKRSDLCNKIKCGTVVKTLAKFIYIVCTLFLSFTAVVDWLRQSWKFVKVEKPHKNPCCCLKKIIESLTYNTWHSYWAARPTLFRFTTGLAYSTHYTYLPFALYSPVVRDVLKIFQRGSTLWHETFLISFRWISSHPGEPLLFKILTAFKISESFTSMLVKECEGFQLEKKSEQHHYAPQKHCYTTDSSLQLFWYNQHKIGKTFSNFCAFFDTAEKLLSYRWIVFKFPSFIIGSKVLGNLFYNIANVTYIHGGVYDVD